MNIQIPVHLRWQSRPAARTSVRVGNVSLRSGCAGVLIALGLSPTIGAQHRSSTRAVVNDNPLTQLAAQFSSTGRNSCDARGPLGGVGGPAAQWAAAFSRLPGAVRALTTSRSLPRVTQGVDGTTDQTLNMTLPDGVF